MVVQALALALQMSHSASQSATNLQIILYRQCDSWRTPFLGEKLGHAGPMLNAYGRHWLW